MSELPIPPRLPTSTTPFGELLRRQERAVSTAQLHELGVSAKVITRLAREGWLHHKHRGVWMVGPPPYTLLGSFWAAHLATRGTISHRSAAAFHQMRASYWKVELTVAHAKAPREGLVLHRTRVLPRTLDSDGLPITTVEQTLLDCAEVLTPRELEIAIDQAETHGTLDWGSLRTLIEGANGRRGIAPLRRAVDAWELGRTLTESALEERFLELLSRRGFVRPRTQYRLLGYRCDFAWPDQRIAIETDGGRFHRTTRSREQDAQRDRVLRRAGWTVDRVSYRQVFFGEAEVVLVLDAAGVPRRGGR